MLTHKEECLQQREQILKKEVSGFPIYIHLFLFVSQKRGSSKLLHCVPQLACKLVNFLIGQLLINVDRGGGLMTLHDYGYLPPELLKSYPVSE